MAEAIVLLLVVGGIVVYCIPSIIASNREADDALGIVIVNLLLGWLLLPWIACLIWACASPSRIQRRQHAQLMSVLGGDPLAGARDGDLMRTADGRITTAGSLRAERRAPKFAPGLRNYKPAPVDRSRAPTWPYFHVAPMSPAEKAEAVAANAELDREAAIRRVPRPGDGEPSAWERMQGDLS
jgi:hypothetical protein